MTQNVDTIYAAIKDQLPPTDQVSHNRIKKLILDLPELEITEAALQHKCKRLLARIRG